MSKLLGRASRACKSRNPQSVPATKLNLQTVAWGKFPHWTNIAYGSTMGSFTCNSLLQHSPGAGQRGWVTRSCACAQRCHHDVLCCQNYCFFTSHDENQAGPGGAASSLRLPVWVIVLPYQLLSESECWVSVWMPVLYVVQGGIYIGWTIIVYAMFSMPHCSSD